MISGTLGAFTCVTVSKQNLLGLKPHRILFTINRYSFSAKGYTLRRAFGKPVVCTMIGIRAFNPNGGPRPSLLAQRGPHRETRGD